MGQRRNPWELRFDQHAAEQLVLVEDPATRRLDRVIVDAELPKPMQSDVHYDYDPAGTVTSSADNVNMPSGAVVSSLGLRAVEIGPVDGRGLDTDQHLVVGGNRTIDLDDADDFGRAVPLLDRSSHHSPSPGSTG